jgi:hypothetical protein
MAYEHAKADFATSPADRAPRQPRPTTRTTQTPEGYRYDGYAHLKLSQVETGAVGASQHGV